jgi:hypothetical protein
LAVGGDAIVIAQSRKHRRAFQQSLIRLEEKGIVTVGLPAGIDHVAGVQDKIRIERHQPIGHLLLRGRADAAVADHAKAERLVGGSGSTK